MAGTFDRGIACQQGGDYAILTERVFCFKEQNERAIDE